MGQPKKAEPRTKQFNLSLTESEFDNLRRRAEAVGMRPVHFGRALLLDPRHAPAVKRESTDNMQRLIYGQLARLGNLLNQMVRHLHHTGEPLPADLEPLLKDIRQLIAKAPR